MNPYELRKKFYNLATTTTPWYKIINQVDGPTQIQIFNIIGGGDGISADVFIHDLGEISGPVELRINSEGGEVFQAKPIYNALSRLPDVAVIIDGIAASAASFIAMAASPGKLYMSKIGTMMIHDGMVMAAGTSEDLRSLAEVLDQESNTIAGIYAERASKPAEYFREKMRVETWYNAQQALDEGLCDGILDARTGKLTNMLQNAASVPYVGERQPRHEPMTGRHRHDHAAYEADDHDDGMHYHMHEHQNDADHHHNHAAGMGDEGNMHTDHDTPTAVSEVVLAASFPEAQFYNRTFSTEQRQKLAKSGAARKDGSYPIETCADAHNARLAYGRANEGDRAAVAAHIRSREKALGGCGREPFQSGSSSNSTTFNLEMSDEEIHQFVASLKGEPSNAG